MEAQRLWAACRAGDAVALQAAVAAGANVNALYTLEGGCRQPPLFAAALNGHDQLVRLMVTRYGADLDARDSDGETVFGFLGRYGRDEVAAQLHSLKQEVSSRGSAPQPQLQPQSHQRSPDEDHGLPWTQLMARAVREEAAQAVATEVDTPTAYPAGQQARQARLMLQDLCTQMQELLSSKAEIVRRREALQVERMGGGLCLCLLPLCL
jgi:hypothetical protein